MRMHKLSNEDGNEDDRRCSVSINYAVGSENIPVSVLSLTRLFSEQFLRLENQSCEDTR